MNKKSNYEIIKTTADCIYSSGILPNTLNIKRALSIPCDEAEIANYLYQWEINQLKEIIEKVKNDNYFHIESYVKDRAKGLENSLALVRATMESTGDGILVTSSDGHMLDYNERFVELWRVPRDVLERRDDAVALQHVMNQLANPEEFVKSVQYEYEHTSIKTYIDLEFKDGRVFERYCQPYNVNEQVKGRVWSFRDVTEKRNAEKNLRILQKAIESASEGIIITTNLDTNKNFQVIYANKALKDITGFEYDNQNDVDLFDLLRMKDKGINSLNLHDIFSSEKIKPIEVLCQRKNDDDYWAELNINPVEINKNNATQYFVVIITDITERKNIEAQLIHQATHDYLTELPNRTILYDRISQAILYAEQNKMHVGVLFIDIDNFKVVNDSLGHSVGDTLIQLVAKRFIEDTFFIDTVGRWGGDEFIIVVPSVKNEYEIINVAQKIMQHLSKPFTIHNYNHYLTVSIGISIYPKDGKNSEILISNADAAMYQAKALGRNNFSFFTHQMNEKVHERLKIQNGLSTAIEKKELSLVFQPVIDIKNNKVVSVEALLRWNFNGNENISPTIFIPVAEETGLMIPIGNWVLEQACMMNRYINELGVKLNVAVNVSIRQLNHGNFTELVHEMIDKYEIDPQKIIVELTESTLMQSVSIMLKKIAELKKLGIKIAIDDFGTGYSSLSYLKKLSVDILKIDKSFIDDFPDKKFHTDIVSTIITLAKTFELTVIAEGVETKEQVDALKELDCDEIQGYFYAKPMSVNDLLIFLSSFKN